MSDSQVETVYHKMNCIKEQFRLGFEKPLPMFGVHWITGDGHHRVRVFDSCTQASMMMHYMLIADPKTFANCWLENE